MYCNRRDARIMTRLGARFGQYGVVIQLQLDQCSKLTATQASGTGSYVEHWTALSKQRGKASLPDAPAVPPVRLDPAHTLPRVPSASLWLPLRRLRSLLKEHLQVGIS